MVNSIIGAVIAYSFFTSICFRIFISMKDPKDGDSFVEFWETETRHQQIKYPRLLVLILWSLAPLLLTAHILRKRPAS